MYGKTSTITVQEKTESTNDLGEVVTSWSDKGTVEGVVWTLRGDETYQSATDTRIIRYRMACDIEFTITEDERIQFDSRTFDIEVVNDLNNQGRRYEIDLKEVK